ncbi:Geranylgeranyl pyrophosphate synthase-like [Oopsacas minuta]|uniref:Geranylgeranyl pyrophosphate synthase-like n=1 Tax=Oopsacas minuta TaxID=111878 RepID=A0AAV7JQM8_9METZ|nr:Geranylgeranyl pyrophosphate synthase-like [Oopsacas minuta]
MAENKPKFTDDVLTEPYHYLTQKPGKGVRLKLVKAFNHWLNISHHTMSTICEVTQMLHNASLLVDDIEDDSVLRRSLPVAHKVFGTPQTLNCANYMYFVALNKIVKLQNPETVDIFSDALLKLHKGQGMDIYWRDNFVCPTEEEYREMAISKTAGLFRLAIDIMQVYSENKRDLGPLVVDIGLYFQIRDDYANLVSEEYEKNKSFAEDLSEGKFSFPIIHGFREEKDSQIQAILRQRTTDFQVKKYCTSLLRKIGSLEYTEGVLAKLEVSILEKIKGLGGNPLLEAMIKELAKVYSVS